MHARSRTQTLPATSHTVSAATAAAVPAALCVMSDDAADGCRACRTQLSAVDALQAYVDLQAGSYRFSAMLTGQAADQAAQSVFTIDTDGPVVTITSSPDAINNGGLVSFVFVSEGAAYFQCRWVNVTAGTTTDSFSNCTSPA